MVPRRLHSMQQIRAANHVLQSADPSGINAAGPGSNVGPAVVYRFAGKILAEAYKKTRNEKYLIALEEKAESVRIEGMSAWTDAALLNEAGIPAICFGPGDISLAHAAEEYIPLGEIDRATDVLGSFAQRWCF